MLADVTLNKYPVFYHYQGGDFLMRAPLGMYMLPALVGWSYGLHAAHYAILAQNAFLLGTILYFSAQLAGGSALRFLALLMLFSPVDILPRLVQNYVESFQSGEFVLQPLIARWSEVAEWQKGAVGLAIALLIVMPFYRIGVTVYDNDMTMRCALAPFFVLGFGFCGAAQRRMDRGQALGAAMAGVILLSAFTGFFEIRRGLADATYAINDCNLLTVTDKVTPGFSISNYLAHVEKAPGWFVKDAGARLEIEDRVCWPGYALMTGR